MENSYKTGLKDGIAIALAYMSVSFTFGIMAANSGIPTGWTLLISMTNLTSAGQLAGIGVIVSGGSYAEIALTQLIINLRYFLMSLSLSQKLENGFGMPNRLAVSFGITDEIYAVAAAKEHDVSPRYMYGLITLPYIGWTLGTLAGAAAGNILPEIVANALGIALYGMFIAIVVPPARKNPRLLPVIGIAAGVSCLIRYVPFLQFISSGFSVIICALTASVIGAAVYPIAQETEKN